MNLQNFVDVAALKAKVAALHKDHNDRVDSHKDGVNIPAGHPARRLAHESIRVLVAQAVNEAGPAILAGAKDEIFDQVHVD